MVVESLVRHRLTAWVLVLTTQALVLMTGCPPPPPKKLFTGATLGKVPRLRSDMREAGPPNNSKRASGSPATTEKTLSELDAKGLIPKLAGVCIYVSGASAASAELAENIGRLWYAYFRPAAAAMEPSRYAHVLLHWPPSNCCHSTT